MTEDQFIALLSKKKAQVVLKTLAAIPQTERRKYAKVSAELYDKRVLFGFRDDKGPLPHPKDSDAVIVGLYATASLSELKKQGYAPIPQTITIQEVFAALKPDWTQGLVDHLVESNPIMIGRIAPLWRDGLCVRPDGDAIILGYYSIWHTEQWVKDEKTFLTQDVWRFFKVEGGGEFSLANHDKFVKNGTATWSEQLISLANAGTLDRQRLLDASLDALERGFGQYRAGWYSRFHAALAPTPDEVAARAQRYLGLLNSVVPPTVSFAVKYVQGLEKASALDPGKLLDGLEPALQARAKGTVMAALKTIERVAKRDKNLSGSAARSAALALVSEDPGVQGKALDLIEKLKTEGDEELQATLAEYSSLVAPSLRARASALAGVSAESVSTPEADFTLSKTTPIQPVTDANEALFLYLAVLESPRDPFEVERAVDGMSRFGAGLFADEVTVSPLRKRAQQIWKNVGDVALRSVLAFTGRALTEGKTIADLKREESSNTDYQLVQKYSLQNIHLARNAELIERVQNGISLPMLSLPSDSSGVISARELSARLSQYRASGVDPGPMDMSLALMRLSVNGRDLALDYNVGSETDRAFAYTLGHDVDVGPTPDLWAAAWCARRPITEDQRIAKMFKTALPNCGIPVEMKVQVQRRECDDGAYFWISVDVPVSVEMTEPTTVLPAMFAQQTRKRFHAAPSSGHTYPDVAWAALVQPANPEPFFREALVHQDTWQKLTDNHTRAYLEPFLRAGPDIGPLGAGVLAYFLACEDKSVTSLAAEASASVLLEGRLSSQDLSVALKQFLMSGALPTARWTKGLAAIAQAGAAAHVCDVICQLLDFAPDDTPRDLGGMLELFYELHVAAETAPERPETLACLETIPGGGKVAKYSKKLRALAAERASLG